MGKRPSVYLETSVISYLTARSSRNWHVAAHQWITREWWEHQRWHHDLFVSELVMEEAERGDSRAVARRMEILRDIPLIQSSKEAELLVHALMVEQAFPSNAIADATHVSIAAARGVDFLLTWNCRHINNATRKRQISEVCHRMKLACPVICTPEELMGDRR